MMISFNLRADDALLSEVIHCNQKKNKLQAGTTVRAHVLFKLLLKHDQIIRLWMGI